MQGILDKKIPSLLGIFIIVAGIAATTFLVKSNQLLQINAGPLDEPKNVEVTNISDTSFTVIYTTDGANLGTLSIGENPNSLNQTVLDDRDKNSQKITDYKTHSITANNLSPNTEYYFIINSGDISYNDKTPVSVRTASGPVSTSPNTQLSGKIINRDGTVPTDGIVIAKVKGAQSISAIMNKDGSYALPLSSLRTSELDSQFEINESTTIKIDFYSSGLKSSAVLTGNELAKIPVITLSKNYDFSENKTKVMERNNSENNRFPEFNSKLKSQPNSSIKPSPTNSINQ